MKIAVIISVLALAGCAASAQVTPSKFATLEPVSLPDYEGERGIQWAATREEYAAARADTRFMMEQFTYLSDGLTVGAYVYRPREIKGSSPVILFNRGSFTRPTGFAGEMLVMANRYAQAGFIVIAPHYRGSNGWQGRDELGGADLHDLMNIVPELGRIQGADAARLFLAGESRGGAMVYMALRDGFPARAASVWGAFTDLDPLIAPGGPQAKYAPLIWPDLKRDRAAIVASRSALHWPDRIKVPILIMHGGADADIPFEQSKSMDAALTRLGKTHEYIVFEDQQHVIGGRGSERDAASIAWFRRFGAN